MTWGASQKYNVKRVKKVEVNGYTGVYTGETSKEEGKLEGNGVFDSKEILIFGGFVDGKLNPDHKSIVFDKTTHEI